MSAITNPARLLTAGARPASIYFRGAEVRIDVHDAYFLKRKGEALAALATLHPDRTKKNGRTFQLLMTTYLRWIESEKQWYAVYGLQLPRSVARSATAPSFSKIRSTLAQQYHVQIPVSLPAATPQVKTKLIYDCLRCSKQFTGCGSRRPGSCRHCGSTVWHKPPRIVRAKPEAVCNTCGHTWRSKAKKQPQCSRCASGAVARDSRGKWVKGSPAVLKLARAAGAAGGAAYVKTTTPEERSARARRGAEAKWQKYYKTKAKAA